MRKFFQKQAPQSFWGYASYKKSAHSFFQNFKKFQGSPRPSKIPLGQPYIKESTLEYFNDHRLIWKISLSRTNFIKEHMLQIEQFYRYSTKGDTFIMFLVCISSQNVVIGCLYVVLMAIDKFSFTHSRIAISQHQVCFELSPSFMASEFKNLSLMRTLTKVFLKQVSQMVKITGRKRYVTSTFNTQ